MRKVKNILFVCTGNSCRSIMAEGLLKKMLAEKGRDDINIFSAGVSAIGGFTPTDKTVEVMKKEGVDVSSYKTSKLTPEMVNNADIILTMDKIHKGRIVDLVPEARSKTHLLNEYANKKGSNLDPSILDPIGKPLEVYERVLQEIKVAIEELVKRL
jgi:protein-tyrosine-phosphatase